MIFQWLSRRVMGMTTAAWNPQTHPATLIMGASVGYSGGATTISEGYDMVTEQPEQQRVRRRLDVGGWILIGLVVAAAVFGVVWYRAGTPGAVPWGDYAPTVRTRIDTANSARDCVGMQAQFDAADASNTATMTRTGHNNAALMSYIDDAMKSAGCYS